MHPPAGPLSLPIHGPARRRHPVGAAPPTVDPKQERACAPPLGKTGPQGIRRREFHPSTVNASAVSGLKARNAQAHGDQGQGGWLRDVNRGRPEAGRDRLVARPTAVSRSGPVGVKPCRIPRTDTRLLRRERRAFAGPRSGSLHASWVPACGPPVEAVSLISSLPEVVRQVRQAAARAPGEP